MAIKDNRIVYNRPESVIIDTEQYIIKYGSVEQSRSKFFNIGAAAWEHPCWTNLDLPAQTRDFAKIQSPCIHHDLVNNSKLPIQSASVDAFYCSHVVEHIPESAVLSMMKESFRSLNKDGVLRISTGPCSDLDWSALMRKDSQWWFWDENFDLEGDSPPMTIYDRWLYEEATPKSPYSKTKFDKKYTSSEVETLVKKYKESPELLLDIVTDSIQFDPSSAGDHITWWNYDKLRDYLLKAGFKNIYRSGYGQSSSPWMRDLTYFDQTYPQISVYIEAIK
jgi:hypothetical protein